MTQEDKKTMLNLLADVWSHVGTSADNGEKIDDVWIQETMVKCRDLVEKDDVAIVRNHVTDPDTQELVDAGLIEVKLGPDARIRFFCRDQKTGARSEERDLEIGKYNEFYLPAAVDRRKEIWVVATFEGVETKLHLKW